MAKEHTATKETRKRRNKTIKLKKLRTAGKQSTSLLTIPKATSDTQLLQDEFEEDESTGPSLEDNLATILNGSVTKQLPEEKLNSLMDLYLRPAHQLIHSCASTHSDKTYTIDQRGKKYKMSLTVEELRKIWKNEFMKGIRNEISKEVKIEIANLTKKVDTLEQSLTCHSKKYDTLVNNYQEAKKNLQEKEKQIHEIYAELDSMRIIPSIIIIYT